MKNKNKQLILQPNNQYDSFTASKIHHTDSVQRPTKPGKKAGINQSMDMGANSYQSRAGGFDSNMFIAQRPDNSGGEYNSNYTSYEKAGGHHRAASQIVPGKPKKQSMSVLPTQ